MLGEYPCEEQNISGFYCEFEGLSEVEAAVCADAEVQQWIADYSEVMLTSQIIVTHMIREIIPAFCAFKPRLSTLSSSQKGYTIKSFAQSFPQTEYVYLGTQLSPDFS
jgi:hypothetical protein